MRGPEPRGVVAVFDTREGVASAIDWLHVSGIERSAVSILGPASEPSAKRDLPELDHGAAHLREVAAYWAEWGAGLGTAAGAGPTAISLVAATVGIGPLAAVLVPALALVAAPAGIGALAAALTGAGLHEQKAREYERALADHCYLVVVHTDDPASIRSATTELTRLGARTIDVHGV